MEKKSTANLKFSYVKKTAPSFNNILVKTKNIALGAPNGPTVPCNRPKCVSCQMMSGENHIKGKNKRKIPTANGTCTTRNVVYHAQCVHCPKDYSGKTTQPLSKRINGHRNKFQDCVKTLSGKKVEFGDEHLLGVHVFHHHGLKHPSAFNKSYKFTLLERCNPRTLDRKEHEWIQRLHCVAPYGLNAHDPFGMSLVV